MKVHLMLMLLMMLNVNAWAGSFNDNDQFELSNVTLDSEINLGEETELSFSGELLNLTVATWNSAGVTFELPTGATPVLPMLFSAMGPSASISSRESLIVRAPTALAPLLISQIESLSLPYTINGSETPVYTVPVVEWDEESDREFTDCVPGTNPDELTCSFTNSTPLLAGLTSGDYLIIGDYKQVYNYALDTAPAVPTLLSYLPAEVLANVGAGPVTLTIRRVDDAAEYVLTASFEDSTQVDAFPNTISPDDYDLQVADCDPAEAPDIAPCYLPSIPIRFNEVEVDAGLFLSGEIRLTLFKPSGRIRIRPGDESSIALGFDAGYAVTLAAEARADVDLGGVDVKLADITVPVTQLNLGIPLYVTVSIDFLAGAEGSLKAGTTVTIHSEGSSYLGLTWSTADGLTADSEFEGIPFEVTAPELTQALRANARIWSGLEASLRLSLDPANVVGSAGPVYRFNVGAGIDVTPLGDNLWSLAYDARHQATFEVNLPTWEITPLDTNEAIEPLGTEEGGETPPNAREQAAAPKMFGLSPWTPVVSGELVRWARVLADDVFLGARDLPLLRQQPLAFGRMLYYGYPDGGNGFVGKLGRLGRPLWERELTFSTQPVGAVELTSRELLLAGNRNNDFWLMLLSPTGDMLAFEVYESDPVCELFSMAQGLNASADTVVLAGRVTNSNIQARDICLIGVDLNRNVLWSHVYESFGDDEPDEIIALTNGHFGLAGGGEVETTDPAGYKGGMVGVVDASGTMQWLKLARVQRAGRAFNALTEAPDGTLFAGGHVLRNVNDDDIAALWVAQFSPDGSQLEHHQYEQDFEWEDELGPWTPTTGGSTANDEAFDLIYTDEGLIVSGKTGSGADQVAGWLLRLRPNMAVDWHLTYDGLGNEILYDVKEAHGGLQILGSTTSHLPNGDRGLLAMRVPYEGMMRFADDTDTTMRFLQPRSVRTTQNAIFDSDDGNLLDIPWIRADITVTPSTSSTNDSVEALPFFSDTDELALTNRFVDPIFDASFELQPSKR